MGDATVSCVTVTIDERDRRHIGHEIRMLAQHAQFLDVSLDPDHPLVPRLQEERRVRLTELADIIEGKTTKTLSSDKIRNYILGEIGYQPVK